MFKQNTLGIGNLVKTRVHNDSESSRVGIVIKAKAPYYDVDIGAPYGSTWVICEHVKYLEKVQ